VHAYFLIDDALRFFASAVACFFSATRSCRILAYSFYATWSALKVDEEHLETYGGILCVLCCAALECDTVTLVLETLRGDKTLNLGGFGVWLCTFLLGLNLTTDNELANL
jgi:hypothetical protein